jgi:cardiolipin synthase A/B
MWIAIAASVVTLLVIVVGINLASGEKHIQTRIDRLYSVRDEQFQRSMSVLLGPPIVKENHVETLLNGSQAFPAMLKAIRGAKKTITFESYVFETGEMGDEFIRALSERALAGVKTHVMLDFMGSMKADVDRLDALEAAGVQLQRYHKPVWWHFARLNNRTHRKTLVIDGRVGFTGGLGVADQWLGNAENEQHWRDTHFRVQGPVVAQIQSVFIDNWIKATGRVLDGEEYFPDLSPPGKSAGAMGAQMFRSSPTGGSESMQLMYLISITSAEHSILLSNAYFVPDRLAVDALVEAAKRGVDVRVIVPGTLIDTETVRKASRGLWGPLLEAGVKIAEYQPTMFHVKCLVVDSCLVSVGSTNFDNRSFSINDEANLNVFDQAFAEEQERVFEMDWAKSKPMTLDAWRKRPWAEKVVEKAAGLLKSQL